MLLHHFSYISLIFLQAHIAAAAHGWITLVNSTPYSWHLTHSHSYQMRAWHPLKAVEAGSSQEFFYQYSIKTNKDDAAEATYTISNYTLPGVCGNTSFTIQVRSREHKRIEVQYNNGLSSLGNSENTLLNLGREESGSIPFVLAGDGKDVPFISNNPPVAWMQASLPIIGNRTLQQFSMLASHDSGASEITKSYMGIRQNTLTQSQHVYGQLVSGARVLDIRPALRNGKWYTSHLAVINRLTAFGALTRTLEDVIRDINEFMVKYPGELIILDISHDVSRREWSRLSDEEWTVFYKQLLAINNLWEAPNLLREDIATVPLSLFIRPGSESAVVIRVPRYAPLPDEERIAKHLPFLRKNKIDGPETSDSSTQLDPTNGILDKDRLANGSFSIAKPKEPTTVSRLPVFHPSSLPISGEYSNTLSSRRLVKSQLARLHAHKLSTTPSMFRSVWTLTQNWQQVLNVGMFRKTILSLSVHARRQMYKSLWKAIKEEGIIPNLVEIDDVRGHNMIAFVMAINYLSSKPQFDVGYNNTNLALASRRSRRKRAILHVS